MKLLNSRTAPKSSSPERIIQFGEGNFLRAFVDWIVQRMNDTTDFNSSVVMLQGTPRGTSMPRLAAQDYMYHVNLQGRSGGRVVDTIERIDVISRGLNPWTQADAVADAACREEMRFVFSNTTEAGIAFDASCTLNDATVTNYPARLAQMLYRRYVCFGGDPSKGLIIMPCELIFHNGRTLKRYINDYIDLWREELGADYAGFREWFNRSNYVCSTLVDRIVTGFPPEADAEAVQARTCYRDNAVVQGEPYHLWVIERPDNMDIDSLKAEFPAHRAGLNVVFTDDEEAYHRRKVTLLNGPHTLLSPVAWLCGIDIVRDACNHPDVRRYIDMVEYDELMPTLDLPEEELREYAAGVLERFDNPYIDHRLTSIMLNSFSKFKTRDLPALRIYLERKGELPRGIVLGLAAIITCYKGGVRADGTPFEPHDDPAVVALLADLWAGGDTGRVARGVLGATDLIWKEEGDLNDIEGLASLLESYLDKIRDNGMPATVKEITL